MNVRVFYGIMLGAFACKKVQHTNEKSGLFFSKVFGSRVRVDSTAKVAELELAEKVTEFVCFFIVGVIKNKFHLLRVKLTYNSFLLF